GVLEVAHVIENTRTQEQRDKLWDWYRFTLLPVVAPNGRLCIIGTRYHFDDLYGRLLDPMHNSRGIPALIGKAIGDNGAALWPGRYPLAHLQNLRADLGSVIFNAQYQNDAAAMKGSIFKAEWMKRYKELPAGLRLWQYCDLAISQKQTADYFAEVTIAQDKTGAVFVLDAFHARLSFDEQFRRIKLHHDYHHRPTTPVLRVGIEANQYQAALAQQLKTRTRVPVRPVHQHKDKMTRALRLQALFENSKIFFPMAGTEELENELLTFPEGAHDDLVDALAGAADLAGAVRRRPKALRMPRGL
ncbi:MAG: phage terminase large subunit, partial [Alphaproteobacteria bacterium]